MSVCLCMCMCVEKKKEKKCKRHFIDIIATTTAATATTIGSRAHAVLPNPCWMLYNISTFLGTSNHTKSKCAALCLCLNFIGSIVCGTCSVVSYRLLLFLMYILPSWCAIPCATIPCAKVESLTRSDCCAYAWIDMDVCLLEMLHTIHRTW